MQIVERAVIRPSRCAVLPHLGGAHRDGYFDTGSEMPGFDNRVYVSVVAVREMARELGWHSPEQQQAYDGVLAAKDSELAELREKVAEYERFRDAAEYTLGQFGAKVRNKPGRKPAEKAAA